MSSPLDNLCGPGKALQLEAPDANELAGLLRSGNPPAEFEFDEHSVLVKVRWTRSGPKKRTTG